VPVRRELSLDFAPDIAGTLSPLRLGRGDPTTVIGANGVWTAVRTPDGTGTLQVKRGCAPNIVEATAWGDGAGWLLDRVPAMVGAHDDLTDFDPALHPVVARAARANPGLRIASTGRVLEVLVPTILAQKVTGLEAKRSWRRLVRLGGERAPGPGGLLLAPEPRWLATLPDAAFHRIDVERKRASAIRAVAAAADRLEEGARLGVEVLRARLASIPGIGPWTIAEVAIVAAGDADAVSVGDYHLPNLVSWALAGEPRGDDTRMLELLAPFVPHRGRVQRLLERSGLGAPRYGPRLAPRPIAWH
jgi:3-methyladenine DNA glycosylase/8-oxoguanine DNA glycosylase